MPDPTRPAESASSESTPSVLMEILATWLILLGALWGLSRGWPAFQEWQATYFHHPVLTVLAVHVMIPVAVLAIRRRRAGTPILRWDRIWKSLRGGGKALNIMLPVTFLSFPLAGGLGWDFYTWRGGLYIAFWHLAAVPALCMLLKSRQTPEHENFAGRDLQNILLGFILVVPAVYLLGLLHPKAAGVLVALVFIGQTEEFFFRSYIQGTLNRTLGRPFTVMGYSFGWGLLLASLLFGLSHVFSPSNPLHWAWGFWTFIAGIGYGVIRDKSGTFVGSGLVHGIIMIFPVFFS